MLTCCFLPFLVVIVFALPPLYPLLVLRGWFHLKACSSWPLTCPQVFRWTCDIMNVAGNTDCHSRELCQVQKNVLAAWSTYCTVNAQYYAMNEEHKDIAYCALSQTGIKDSSAHLQCFQKGLAVHWLRKRTHGPRPWCVLLWLRAQFSVLGRGGSVKRCIFPCRA